MNAKVLWHNTKESWRYTRNNQNAPNMSRRNFFKWVVMPAVLFGCLICANIWLDNADIESARWGLSAQTQSTAAIFGLVLAIGAIRWQSVSQRQSDMRKEINALLVKLGDARCGAPQNRVTDQAYDQYKQWVMNRLNAGEKISLEIAGTLGRLWVIRMFATGLETREVTSLNYPLKHYQIIELRKIHLWASESAIGMNEDYYEDPAMFAIKMYHTLVDITAHFQSVTSSENPSQSIPQNSSSRLDQKYIMFDSVKETFISKDIWPTALWIAQSRQIFTVIYVACAILAVAVISGLVILAGLGGDELPSKFLVLVPFGISAYGLWITMLLVFGGLR